MTPQKTPSTDSRQARIERRFARKTTEVANRLRSLMGDILQTDLADRVGKSDSTVSEHLSGKVNLTLRTIAEYEVALDDAAVTVPDVKRPNRRRRSSGTRRAEERKVVKDIDPVKRRLHRLLTGISALIGQALDERDEFTQHELASRLGKDASYVSRVLGGGVNLTLKTIVQFEEVLGVRILCVKGIPSRGSFTGRREASEYVDPFRTSNDGCYLDDHGGRTSSGITNWWETKDQDCVSDEPEMVAA